MAPLHDDKRYLGVQPGKGAQLRSGAFLKKLSIKLETLNSPSTVPTFNLYVFYNNSCPRDDRNLGTSQFGIRPFMKAICLGDFSSSYLADILEAKLLPRSFLLEAAVVP